jgi:hypothetical protein
MSTTIEGRSAHKAVEAPVNELAIRRSKTFAVIAYFAVIVGAFSLLGGMFGIGYTYQQAAAENISTPDDAVLAEVPVRGPLTMWSQSDIITKHQLNRTEGLRFAEMPRLIEQVDPETGEVVLGEDGEPAMVPNQTRDSWIGATTLTTALGLGIISYAFSAFAMVVGLALIGLGWVVLQLRKSPALLA